MGMRIENDETERAYADEVDEEINRRADRAAVILAGFTADGTPVDDEGIFAVAVTERALFRAVATLYEKGMEK